jgi:translation initiation factor 2 beta subunit (eIF-2beta)/eIF-5
MESENEKVVAEMKINREELDTIIKVFKEKYDEKISYSKKEEISIKFQKIYDKIMILLFVWLVKRLFVWLIS